jgi:hypothetical protein
MLTSLGRPSCPPNRGYMTRRCFKNTPKLADVAQKVEQAVSLASQSRCLHAARHFGVAYPLIGLGGVLVCARSNRWGWCAVGSSVAAA